LTTCFAACHLDIPIAQYQLTDPRSCGSPVGLSRSIQAAGSAGPVGPVVLDQLGGTR
jgi:hypothetical protein